MKAFTVYQPYAFAIAAGLKHYETRPRRTSIRGRVAVHAAIGGPDYISVALDSVLPESMELHYGAVIGTVEIVDCVPVENLVDAVGKALGHHSFTHCPQLFPQAHFLTFYRFWTYFKFT